MCEIFCFNSNKATQVNECLKCFYEHCEEHPHGWGLANMDSKSIEINKEPIKAKCSENLKNILSNPVIGKNIFAHIRLATMGELITPNCHPFSQVDDNNRSWILIHNGTIFDYPPLDNYKSQEKGDTDSERILLYIIDKINENNTIASKERFDLLSEIIQDMSLNNKLNLMICDGEHVYIHSNLDGSLYYLRTQEGLLFTTTPISDNENWAKVPINRLFCLKDGEILYKSKRHENEYIETPEQLEYINNFIDSIKENNKEELW